MTDYTTYKAEDFLLDESFINYCSNIKTDTDFWEDFIKQHPDNLPVINQAKKLYSLISIRASSEEKKIAADKLKFELSHQLNDTKVKNNHTSIYATVPAKIKRWLPAMAAAIITGILISVAVWYFSPTLKNYHTTVAEFKKASYLQVIKSGDNDRKRVQLPDGTVAILNYGSTLRISSNYNQTQRWVYLEGEAFFSVQPNKEKPFVVITDKIATSALGTSFKVRNYNGEGMSNVMLATGKVKIQAMENKNNASDILLMPGEQATSFANNLPFKTEFDQTVLQDWRTMTIVFDKANLDKIINTLQFYYGVKVTLQNKPLTEIAFTGKFSGQSLKDVLEAISFTNKFTYTQTSNTISILFQ